MAARNPWQTVSIHPLITPLDTRSRPADLAPGTLRWKQNFQVTPDAKLCRRFGFTKAFGDLSPYNNRDFHRQGATRQPITFLHESTSSDGTRRFYQGNQRGVWLLNQTTGEYQQIVGSTTPVGAAGTRWQAAELQDYILFNNNYDEVWWYSPATGIAEPLGSLVDLHITRVGFLIQWNGFLVAMNLTRDGTEYTSRVWWGDINVADGFEVTSGSLAGFQDLDYGDSILSAAPLLGSLFIFTERAIWKMSVSSDLLATDVGAVFSFTKVYTEPKNQTGCIAYPNTLVSDGANLRYMGRDGIYTYNPYMVAPEREVWLHQADGVIYTQADTKLDPNYCLSPIAQLRPDAREIWFSWPSSGQDGVNNWSLVAQYEQKSADVVDHGFTALANYRRTAVSPNECNEVQDFMGASGQDYCIKSIGNALSREMVTLDASGDVTVDLLEASTYYTAGYYSIMRGMIPLGLTDRDKTLRSVLIDHDTSEQDTPCVFRLRIGNSYSVIDPNVVSGRSAVIWQQLPDKLLEPINTMTAAEMAAANLRPNLGTEWKLYVMGRFLYFEIAIANQDGTAAVGGDTYLQRIDFDAMAMPKP